MVPNNFQIELKGLPIATSQFTGVKHVTHRETGWENNGSKETGLEYDGFIVYVHFLNLGNLELEWSFHQHVLPQELARVLTPTGRAIWFSLPAQTRAHGKSCVIHVQLRASDTP